MATFAGALAIVMWGMLAVLSVGASSVPPFQLLTLCFGVSALIVIVKRIVKQEPLWRFPTLNLLQWCVTVGGLFGFHFCYFLAIRYAPAIEVSLIGYLWPLLFGVAVALPSYRGFAVMGGLLGFAGCVLLVTKGEAIGLNSDYFAGYILALLCAFIWSGYSWFMSKTNSEVEDIGWASAVVAVLSLIAHVGLETTITTLPWSAWVSALLLGLGPVGGAFYLWDIGVKFGNKQLLASLSFSTPVISALALALFGINALTVLIIGAVGLILCGACVSNLLPTYLLNRR